MARPYTELKRENKKKTFFRNIFENLICHFVFFITTNVTLSLSCPSYIIDVPSSVILDMIKVSVCK